MIEIVVGVVAGVLTAWLLWVLNWFIQNGAIPWYQAKVYKGVDVSGDWHGSIVEGDTTYSFELSIQQKGPVISGIFAAVDKYPDRESRRIFQVTGETLSNHAILRYSPVSQRVWGGGTFLLQVFDGGGTLRGVQSYIKTSTGLVQANNGVALKRKN